MRSADEVDAHVGRRLRQRRTELGISQGRLGQALGLTFQQIQKYEKGQNRISAGRLFRIAGILWVSVQYFFDGIDDETNGATNGGAAPGTPSANAEIGVFLTSPEGRALAAGFVRIGDPGTRRRIVDLVETLAGAGPG